MCAAGTCALSSSTTSLPISSWTGPAASCWSPPGNAPQDDISVQLDIARMMEQAQDPSDALHLYKTILHRHPSLREALEGAGRTAFQMGHYLEAKRYLARALEGPGVDQEPKASLQKSRDRLSEATRLLLLYPSSRLSPQ